MNRRGVVAIKPLEVRSTVTWYDVVVRDVSVLLPVAAHSLDVLFAEIDGEPYADPYSARWRTVAAIVSTVLEMSSASWSSGAYRRLRSFLSENKDLVVPR